jgi:EpsI family protein
MSDSFSLKHVVAGLAMVLALGASVVFEPQKAKAGTGGIALETMVPESFDSWRLDPQARLTVASPDVAKTLSEVYSEMLSRTYVNERGDRVMLSIAYAGDIVRQMDVHRPEVCYPAQGFTLLQQPFAATLGSVPGGLGVMRLVARQGVRIEPITYWISSGDSAGTSTWQRKLVRLRYGLTGQIPDGMLVRVSTIDANPEAAFLLQEAFVKSLVAALPDKDRKRVVGGAI